MTENYFKDLAKIDVSNHIEKKGKFSYLSWAFAVKALREYDHTATWEVMRFGGLPYLKSDAGCFVEVGVTVRGITLSQIHPVLNHQNKPIQNPNAFDINTSIQRCLVKAIALHGLGIWIYAGEDLPVEEKQEEVGKPILLSKWKLLGGDDEKFEPWYQEQVKKYNHNQIDAYLTKKMQEKSA